MHLENLHFQTDKLTNPALCIPIVMSDIDL